MDFRLRGNDGVFFSGIGVVGQWIFVFAGMTLRWFCAGMTQQTCVEVTWLMLSQGYAISGLSPACHGPNISPTNPAQNQRTDEISRLT